MKNNRAIGNEYESLAAAYLEKEGYCILERNYRNKMGEIDIIGKDGSVLTFVEVKYRHDIKKGDPAEAVHGKKQEKIRNVARGYLYFHRLGEEISCRFDVVAILGEEIRLIRNAF